MNAPKEKQRLSSPDGVSCSICLEPVESSGDRSVARLKCDHRFHLDCIGSAFNAKGAMQCPNCRQVEGGQWLYSSGSLLQQEDVARHDIARIHLDMVFLRSERQVESVDLPNEASRWPSRAYRHDLVSQGEEDSPINSYPYFTANERQHQRVPRYHQSGVIVLPSYPGFDPGQADVAHEMGHQSAHPIDVARPLRQDLHPPRAPAVYVQGLQPMGPRSYEESHASMLPDFYPSHMHERPGYRRQMDDQGYEERLMFVRPVDHRHSTYRGSNDTGVTLNHSHMHMPPDFVSQGPMSSLDRSEISRFEATRYGQGHFARRTGTHPSHIANGHEHFASHSFGTGYNGHSSRFRAVNLLDDHGANRVGSRILRL